ncbi:MAG: hypothetical protein QM692_21055, partial [Thermomicrobiales bacterium]
LREPDIQREPVTVDVVDPRNNLIFGIPVLLALLLALAWYFWPSLAKDASLRIEGGNPVKVAPAGITIGNGRRVDPGTGSPFGALKRTPAGRHTGNAKFVAAVDIQVGGKVIKSKSSRVIRPNTTLTDPAGNGSVTYFLNRKSRSQRTASTDDDGFTYTGGSY